MPAHSPEELDLLFMEALNAGHLEVLVALYEPAAVLILAGQVATGTQAIREALHAYIARKPTMRLKVKTIAQTGDIAMTSARWSSGRSVEVSRRQADGTWRFVIDVGNLEWLQRTDS
jgi:ketosteroid isomerase-like protein